MSRECEKQTQAPLKQHHLDMSEPLLNERGNLTYAGFRAVKSAMTAEEWQRVEDKCQWERMIPWAVLNEWPSLRGSGARVLEEAEISRSSDDGIGI